MSEPDLCAITYAKAARCGLLQTFLQTGALEENPANSSTLLTSYSSCCPVTGSPLTLRLLKTSFKHCTGGFDLTNPPPSASVLCSLGAVESLQVRGVLEVKGEGDGFLLTGLIISDFMDV